MSRKVFYPTPTLPLLRGGSKKFTNDLGLLYSDSQVSEVHPDRSHILQVRSQNPVFFKEGMYQNLELPWLRWWDSQGNLLLSGAERADRAEDQLEQLRAQLRSAGIEPQL